MRFIVNKFVVMTFVYCTILGVVHHVILLSRTGITNSDIENVVVGFGYDILNGSLLAFLVLCLSSFNQRFSKLLSGIVLIAFTIFQYIDLNYVEQFGTHLPISTVEYVEEASEFASTVESIILNSSFLLLVFIPILISIFGLVLIQNQKKHSFFEKIVSFSVHFFILTVISVSSGNFSNMTPNRNMNNPLTSAGLTYFNWSRSIEKIDKVIKPSSAIPVVLSALPGEQQIEDKDFLMIRKRTDDTCRQKAKLSKIGISLCNGKKTPNILILMIESFRAFDIGIYGSKVKATSSFDRLSKEGVFFKNFYANGFQTRHGQVATYCSLMPNYGSPIMRKYADNKFFCLPQLLKHKGYQTSWVFGGNSNFDKQHVFLPKIGFDLIFDSKKFPDNGEKTGWGFSDGEIYKQWIKVLDQQQEPFFSSALTMTSHHPFQIPENYKRGMKNDYFEALAYADQMLGDFIKKIKQKSWYENTLIFIMADTSNFQEPQQIPKDFEEFVRLRSQIPFLILGGPIKKPAVIDEYASQIDVAPTIMDLMGVEYTSHWAGHTLLAKESPFIAFTNRPGNYWAVMSKNGRYYNENNTFDHYFGNSQETMKGQYKTLGKSWIRLTKWMLQEDLYWRESYVRN